ncbi:MAG: DUF2812 domain-containing protein [Clostridia bacterium]|nr:DUF2812 domain-containing protein [Clostridia bacterium]
MKKLLRRFIKDPSKKYIRKIRIYPSFAYKSLDKWLNKMSNSGWHLVDSNLISFLFECGEPENKIYFTYNAGWARNDSGKYSIPLRYPFLEKTYGIKPKYSKLNKNQSKTYLTLEIDTQKIDTENNAGYRELINDRNKLYSKLAIRNTIIFVLVILICIITVLLK